MNVLILINDAPFGTEKAYNGFRPAMAFQNDHPTVQVNMFLMADGITCGISNQSTPEGYYNIEWMIKSVVPRGAKLKRATLVQMLPGYATYNWRKGSRSAI